MENGNTPGEQSCTYPAVATVHESSGTARFRLGIWKLKRRAVRRGADTSYPRRRTANLVYSLMPRNTEMESGAPEQQTATYQWENSTRAGTRWQQCQTTEKFSGLAFKMRCRWRKTSWKELNCGWGGGGEWDCAQDRWAINNLNKTWTFQSE